MKTIGVCLSGRMGNQMFQYAFAKALKIAQGNEGELVLNFKRVHQAGEVSDDFDDMLQYFNVEPYRTDNGNLVMKYCSLPQKLVYLAYVACLKVFHLRYDDERWLVHLRKMGLLYTGFKDTRYEVAEQYLHSKTRWDVIICLGKFENARFLDSIRPVLLKEFTPKAAPLKENSKLYEIIENSNSVCVSIRRGDFLSEQFRQKFFVCDESYFRRAIDKARQLIENPVFIFFSNDIEWVKATFGDVAPAYYEPDKSPVWENMRLMYSCKHFIISNSTFSWWAQYLSRNEKKIVISPDHWQNDTDGNGIDYRLLLDSFVKM